MLRQNLFFVLVVAVSSAPAPYYSLIETPTSRVEQHLLLSPQLQQSYKVHPQHVQPFSQFEFPKQQVVYYYPDQQQHQQHFQERQVPQQHVQLQHVHQPLVHHQQHLQQPLNLYQLRQDSPWWQELWNQITAPETDSESEPDAGSEGEEEAIDLLSESNKKPDLGNAATTSEPELANEGSNKLAPKIESDYVEVISAAQPSLLRSEIADMDMNIDVRSDLGNAATTSEPELLDGELKEDTTQMVMNTVTEPAQIKAEPTADTNMIRHHQPVPSNLDIDATTFAPELPSSEPNKISSNEDTDSIIVNSAAQPSQLKAGPTSNINLIHQQQPLMHHIFMHNHRYYIADGVPEFFGNFDAFNNPTAPIFSLQQLQPIMRVDNDNERVQKIKKLPMLATERTSTLRINVADEEEMKEDKDESEHVNARSQFLSDQSKEEEKMSRQVAKQEQTSVEGESTNAIYYCKVLQNFEPVLIDLHCFKDLQVVE